MSALKGDLEHDYKYLNDCRLLYLYRSNVDVRLKRRSSLSFIFFFAFYTLSILFFFKSSNLQIFKSSNLQIFKSSNLQIFKSSNLQIFKSSNPITPLFYVMKH